MLLSLAVMPGLSRASTSWLATKFNDVDVRDECLARGHDRHLFGDMTDTFVLGQVDVCNFKGAEEDAVLTFGCARPDGEAFAAEGFRNFPEVPFEADISFGGSFGGADAANDFTVVVLDLWRL